MRCVLQCDIEVCRETIEHENPVDRYKVGQKVMVQNAKCGHSWFTVLEARE